VGAREVHEQTIHDAGEGCVGRMPWHLGFVQRSVSLFSVINTKKLLDRRDFALLLRLYQAMALRHEIFILILNLCEKQRQFDFILQSAGNSLKFTTTFTTSLAWRCHGDLVCLAIVREQILTVWNENFADNCQTFETTRKLYLVTPGRDVLWTFSEIPS